jgi:hypothetical protein
MLLKYTGFISAAIIASLIGFALPAEAKDRKADKEAQEQRQEERKAEQAAKKQEHREAQAKHLEEVREKQAAQKEAQAKRLEALRERQAAQKEEEAKLRAARQLDRSEYRYQFNKERDLAKDAARLERREDRLDRRITLTKQRQQQLAAKERARRAEYLNILRNQRTAYERRISALKQQNRIQQARVQQAYLNRLAAQRTSLGGIDFLSNPVYYLAPAYQYSRGGQYFQTSRYGASLLENAVNDGYRIGYDAGRADRMDGWSPNYRAALGYQDANYGYTGFSVSRSDYNYYFREGFRRGYEDGYYNRYRYGTSSNGNLGIVETILNQILNMQILR